MSEKNDLKALEELAAAIARLEQRVAAKADIASTNDALATKHAALKSDVSAIIHDLDGLIRGAERG